MQTKGLGSCLLALVVLVGGLLAAGWLSEGGPGPLVLTLILISVVVTFLAMRVFLQILAGYRLLGEPAAIARARHCAGVPGEVVRDGPSTIWYSGPTDPTPMLGEQREAARARFESLLGDDGHRSADAPHPLLLPRSRSIREVPCRAPLRQGPRGLDGHYFPRPWGIIALCTGEAPGRVVEPEITARSLFGFVLIETAFGALPAPLAPAGPVPGPDSIRPRPI